MNSRPIKNVVIAGGGTAGWMAAAAISKLLGKVIHVTIVESDEIPTVGVGEATIPSLHVFHDLLRVSESEFMAATNGTFKLGISFDKWKNMDEDYIHSFGFLGRDCWAAGFQHFWLKGFQTGIASEIGDYCFEHFAARKQKFAVLPKQDRNHAYHIDAGLYAKFLKKIAIENGATRIEGKITQVNLDKANGFIHSIALENGQNIEGDLFIDCTGFRGLLIEGALHTGYEDWSHWLPCDSAIAVQTELTDSQLPYTRSSAHDSGWQWKIPLQTRTGNGIVYCSNYLSDEQAKERLVNNVQGQLINEPRVIKFRTGTRLKHWNKNCVAVGLSSGFLEPLESTSIHLIQQSIVRLMQNLTSTEMEQASVDTFNNQMRFEIDNIRDFIILHYCVTQREDSAFWRYCKTMPIPESLKQRIALFESAGVVYKNDGELFGESSWIQVMLGQGILPKKYHRIVDMMSEEELGQFLNTIKTAVARKADSLPNHLDFIKRYCPSNLLTT